jgi:hypothetical protein
MPTFILNRRVAAEVFEDECIIANLDNGLYYSLQGNAVALINALPNNDAEDMINTIAKPLADKAKICQDELRNIWQELLAEELVVTSSAVQGPLVAPVPATEYQSSALNRYTDMQDLLLLDPIHEVDENGWEKKQ